MPSTQRGMAKKTSLPSSRKIRQMSSSLRNETVRLGPGTRAANLSLQLDQPLGRPLEINRLESHPDRRGSRGRSRARKTTGSAAWSPNRRPDVAVAMTRSSNFPAVLGRKVVAAGQGRVARPR